MRHRRVDAASARRWALLCRLGFTGAWVAAAVSGCAAEVNTLEPGDDTGAGTAGAPPAASGAGGKPSSGGSGVTPTAGTGGAGGTQIVNAFGGTGSIAGAAGAGTAGSGGSVAGGGAAGAGGKAAGGGGQGGSGGKGGSSAGGTASAGSASGGSAGGGNLACLASWKNDACDTCSKQTQGDKLACVDILDCYAANACGPATCGSNDAKCGANKIGKGTAGYPIAEDVYNCLCK